MRYRHRCSELSLASDEVIHRWRQTHPVPVYTRLSLLFKNMTGSHGEEEYGGRYAL